MFSILGLSKLCVTQFYDMQCYRAISLLELSDKQYCYPVLLRLKLCSRCYVFYYRDVSLSHFAFILRKRDQNYSYVLLQRFATL